VAFTNNGHIEIADARINAGPDHHCNQRRSSAR
jgi:hypothetical protein